jgi:hypothetical protein
MRRLARALILALAALPAAAQPDTLGIYFPLAPGNRWEFEVRTTDGDYIEHLRWTVLADSATAGGRAARLATTPFRPGESQGETSTCVLDYRFYVAAWPGVVGDFEHPQCWLIPGGYFGEFWIVPGSPEQVMIGGVPYPARVMYWSDEITYAGTGYATQYYFASDIGPLSFGNYVVSLGVPGGRDYTLVHAVVGGTTFGTPPAPFPYIAPDRFYPLGVGDRWVYELLDYGQPISYLDRQVIGDTTLAGEPYRVLLEQTLSLSGQVTSSQTCAVRLTPSLSWFDWRPIAGTCSPPEEDFPGAPRWVPLTHAPRYRHDCTATVAGSAYPSAACFSALYNTFSAGNNRYGVDLATDIGLTWAFDAYGYSIRLAYARVGDVTYGQSPVGSEPGPGAESLSIAVAPNPSAGPVELALRLPVAADVRVEAYDALGRRALVMAPGMLPAGAHRLALDFGGLAAGVYALRVTAGGLAGVSRLSIAR